MKNYLKTLSRIIAPNVSKQDSQINAPCQNVSAPAEPQEANVITPNNDDSEWGHVYVLLDISGLLGYGYGSPLYFAIKGIYAFAYDAITKHKYKVGIISFNYKTTIITHPTSDLMAIAHALDAEKIYEKRNNGSMFTPRAFIHACTSLYDICLKNKNKRKAIIIITTWHARDTPCGCSNLCNLKGTNFDEIQFFYEDYAVSAAYSKEALIGLLKNYKSFTDTTKFITVSIPGSLYFLPPKLFSTNHITVTKNEDLAQATASVAKLLPSLSVPAAGHSGGFLSKRKTACAVDLK